MNQSVITTTTFSQPNEQAMEQVHQKLRRLTIMDGQVARHGKRSVRIAPNRVKKRNKET